LPDSAAPEMTARSEASSTAPAPRQSVEEGAPIPQPKRVRFPWPAITAGAASSAIIAPLFLVAALHVLPRGHDDGRPPPTGTAAIDSEAASRLSTVESELKTLTESVDTLARRSDEVVAATREARQRADTAAAAVAELRQKVMLSAADAAARDKIAGELQSVSTRVAALERAQAAIETGLAKRVEAQTRDRSARVAVAAMLLDEAVAQGRPFTAELAAAKSLANDPGRLAPLDPFAASGVPTPASLARELSGLMPSLLAALGPASPAGSSLLQRLQANAEKLVRVRPLAEAGGSDPATILARLEAMVAKGDLAAALAALAELPPEVRALAEPWMEKVQKRSAALASSRQFAADALAGLSK
jgi:hypothetical protein